MEQVGGGDVLLPRRIQAGLAANDRIKYYLTLLQSAVTGASNPHCDRPSLRDTRDASGVSDASFDDVVAHSQLLADGSVAVPDAARIRGLVFADLHEMLAPLEAAAQVIPDMQEAADQFEGRLRTLASTTPLFDGDRVAPTAVDAITAARGGASDSVHQLVMDLHHQINQLQMRLPLRDVAGASTWGLADGDEVAVRAFMAGLASTAALKFAHPGLETSATRVAGRLSIQNDLGTTDAHVVVLHVDGLAVTVIYGDIHRRRVDFLKTLLDRHGLVWNDAAPAADGSPITIVGRVTVATQAALSEFLAFFASRLVFLIDWNRARKQLARFVRTAEAMAILRWAADHAVGHRAFVQSGGAGLIYTALERAATRHALAGGRLDELLGRRDASLFLRAVLRIASVGLAAGRSDRVIQDEVEAELLAHLEGGHNGLSLAADHAAYLSSLAERVRHVLLRHSIGGRDDTTHGARLAKRWEARADDIVRRQHQFQDWSPAGDMLHRILQHGDDAADGLEEAAFLLTLVPEQTGEANLRPLATLADLVLNGVRDYVRCLEHARSLPRGRAGADLDEFLVAVDRVLACEGSVDDAERQAHATLVSGCADFRELHVLSAAARALAQAGDALAHAALAGRDYVLTGAADHG